MEKSVLHWLMRFLKNRKAEAINYGMFIGLALAIVIAVNLVPTVFETINDTDTSEWTSLTGGAGAEAIFELILLVFVASIIIWLIKKALA